MKQSSIEWLVEQVSTLSYRYTARSITLSEYVNEKNRLEQQAKEMEKTEKAKHTLFIGKVVDEIGFERTKELLIEVKNAFGE